MIVAFEGLSCVGKSSVINAIVDLVDDAIVIPEWTIKVKAEHFSEDIYRFNDRVKSDLIDLSGHHCVLLDRYYLSSLVCRLQAKNLPPENIAATLAQFAESFRPPDLWVYITDTPDRSWTRSQQSRSWNEADPWLNIDSIRAIDALYKQVFEVIPNVIALSSSMDSQAQASLIRRKISESYHYDVW